mmetsp:Transcript_39215/g.100197  ORF Transcript_39215/g.100197 Transcript_39215/m.100197 type:complete len:291 (-) Transcript_39215:152-1024(-)
MLRHLSAVHNAVVVGVPPQDLLLDHLQEHGLDEEAKHKHVGKNNGDRDGDERRAAPHALHREEHEPQVVDHEAAHDGVLLQRVQEVVLERHVRDVEHKEEGDDAQSAGQLKLRAGRAQENGDQHDGNFPAHDHDLPEVVVLLHAHVQEAKRLAHIDVRQFITIHIERQQNAQRDADDADEAWQADHQQRAQMGGAPASDVSGEREELGGLVKGEVALGVDLQWGATQQRQHLRGDLGPQEEFDDDNGGNHLVQAAPADRVQLSAHCVHIQPIGLLGLQLPGLLPGHHVHI